MTSQQDSLQKEIAQLKSIVDALRSSGKRRRFPPDIRQRITALQSAGVSVASIARHLGIATSMIYGWVRAESDAVAPRPRIFAVAAPGEPVTPCVSKKEPAQSAVLELRLGAFLVTVAVGEG